MIADLPQKSLDLLVSLILSLLLVLGYLFRSAPIDFMTPGFRILRVDDLSHAETFVLEGSWYATPQRTSKMYDREKVEYEMVFHVGDPSQIFPDMQGIPNPTQFSLFHIVSRYRHAEAAQLALQQSYDEYQQELSEYLVPFTDVPLSGFKSQADRSLLWCERFPRESGFNAETVQTCYYWAVYDRYFVRTRMNMWPIAGGGRQFSLKVFDEAITLAEGKFLSRFRIQR